MNGVTVLRRKMENLVVFAITMFLGVLTFAQDSMNVVTTNTTTTSTTEEWFSNPLYWIIGAILLIILIAVVARGNSNRRA